jgi:hypothetical protein
MPWILPDRALRHSRGITPETINGWPQLVKAAS